MFEPSILKNNTGLWLPSQDTSSNINGENCDKSLLMQVELVILPRSIINESPPDQQNQSTPPPPPPQNQDAGEEQNEEEDKEVYLLINFTYFSCISNGTSVTYWRSKWRKSSKDLTLPIILNVVW